MPGKQEPRRATVQPPAHTKEGHLPGPMMRQAKAAARTLAEKEEAFAASESVRLGRVIRPRATATADELYQAAVNATSA